MMINNIKEQLRRDEGFRATVYTDTLGKQTIGIGRCLDTHPLTQPEANYLCGVKGLSPDNATEILITKGISEAQAEWLLDHQITDIIGRLLAKYGWMQDMSDERFGVCINITYQMGFRGFCQFKHAIGAMEVGHYAAAAAELLDSRWRKQTPERAERLAKQMITNEWL